MSIKYVDRTEASKILKVSTRTIDRYIRKNRFKTKKNGRKVMIKQTDVDKIIQDQIGHFIDGEQASTPKETTKASVPAVKDVKVKEVKTKEEGVYKELYAESKKEIKEKQERLDAATYRVGQLEAQLKNMVPLLDFNRKEKELKEAQVTMQKKEVELTEKISETERQLQSERVLKWVYLSLVGTLLVVEPILFLFWAFG